MQYLLNELPLVGIVLVNQGADVGDRFVPGFMGEILERTSAL